MGNWRDDKTGSCDQSCSYLPLLWRWEGRVTDPPHSSQKKSCKPSVFWGAIFCTSLLVLVTLLFLWRRARCCSMPAVPRPGRTAGIGVTQQSGLPRSVVWPLYSWGSGEGDGSTAGGLPPASLLLKGRAVAIGLATAGCLPGGPALISVLHCLCFGSLEPAWISLRWHDGEILWRGSTWGVIKLARGIDLSVVYILYQPTAASASMGRTLEEHFWEWQDFSCCSQSDGLCTVLQPVALVAYTQPTLLHLPFFSSLGHF